MVRMIRVVGFLVLVAGCDLVFPLNARKPDPVDANGDAPRGNLAECPPGYQPIVGAPTTSRYRKGGLASDWLSASADCVDDLSSDKSVHTHLLVVGDQTEIDAVDNAFPNTATFWIGLSDSRSEGFFQTVSTEVTSFPADNTPGGGAPPWAMNQPDNTPTDIGQDCVHIRGHNDAEANTLDDELCQMLFDYLCECDSFPDDPTKY
jgi:Lectin C-type domain